MSAPVTPWPTTVAEAEAVQESLRSRVVTVDDHPSFTTVAGLDLAYDTASDRAVAAVVVLDARTLERLETATAAGRATFPYAPGVLAFREIPLLLAALDRLDRPPDLLVCDGHGIAHPRRLGLASHLGVLLDRPSIGVAKTPFVGASAALGVDRGATADIDDDGEVVGRALRTQHGVKPVYVSVGHRISLDTACDTVLALAPRFRLPETTRQADAACREALRLITRPG
jgi:deoxyribonuclease V